MILRQLFLLIVVSMLSACGGTTDDTINYETSNGAVLWHRDSLGISERYFSRDYGTYLHRHEIDSNGQEICNVSRQGHDGEIEVLFSSDRISSAGEYMTLIKGPDAEKVEYISFNMSPDDQYLSIYVTYIDAATKKTTEYSLDISALELFLDYYDVHLGGASYGVDLALRLGGKDWSVSPLGLQVLNDRLDQVPDNLDIPAIADGLERSFRTGYSQGMYMRVDYGVLYAERRAISATVSAYDEGYNLLWRQDIEPSVYTQFYHEFTDTGLWINATFMARYLECSMSVFPISLTGLGELHRVACPPSASEIISPELSYFQGVVDATSKTMLISKKAIDNSVIAEYRYQLDKDLEEFGRPNLKLLENGKLAIKIYGSKNIKSWSTPWNAKTDIEVKNYVLILNSDFSLYADIELAKHRIVSRPNLVFDYEIYFEETTPFYRIDEIFMSTQGDIYFNGDYVDYFQDDPNDVVTPRVGVLH